MKRLPSPNLITENGVKIITPYWIPKYLIPGVIKEIDNVRCDDCKKEFPKDWEIEITIPIFETPYSKSGLARGLTDYAGKRIIVGWRVKEDESFLPALKHELGHILHGEGYGH